MLKKENSIFLHSTTFGNHVSILKSLENKNKNSVLCSNNSHLYVVESKGLKKYYKVNVMGFEVNK